MATGPVVYQVGPLSPSGTRQSAELRSEQLEMIPFPLGATDESSDSNWPPAGFTGTSMPTTSTGPTIVQQLPDRADLAWTQGDTATFQWMFTDVNWTDVDPENVDAPEWVETIWASQVRNPYLYSTYAADYWVPAYGYQYNWWRGHSMVAEFDCTSELIEMPDTDPQRWATLVTMNLPADRSCNILPANWYHWDLQNRRVEDNDVKTRLAGKVRVTTEWTVA
jgi:hypothetical protein